MHPEPFTLIVREDVDVDGFADLKGKRVNVGNPGSGQRATTEVVMDAYGIEMGDFSLAAELKGAEMAQALCDGKIDAMIYTIGHPAAAITEAATTCDVELIDVAGAPIDKLVADNAYYRRAVVPGGIYKGNSDDVKTFGVGATFVTSLQTPEDVVYTVVKAVFENFGDFRKLHPAFNNLRESEMIKDGLSAPLHPGARNTIRARLALTPPPAGARPDSRPDSRPLPEAGRGAESARQIAAADEIGARVGAPKLVFGIAFAGLCSSCSRFRRFRFG